MFDSIKINALVEQGIIFGRQGEKRTQLDMRLLTIGIPDNYQNPSAHICSHLSHIQNNYSDIFKGSKIGIALEDLFLDTLINFKNANGDSIPLDSIHTNKLAVKELGGLDKYCVDIDMLLNRKSAMFFKTSLRERWKQWDRDALVIEYIFGLVVEKTFIFFRENKEASYEKCLDFAKKIQSQFKSRAKILNLYDEEGIYNFFDSLVTGGNS